MDRLSYRTLKNQNYEGYLLPEAPERFLQFGEGNFLRAFVDYFVDIANEKLGYNSKVAVFQPIEPGMAQILNEQDCLYTVYLRGLEKGEKVASKRIVSSISRCVNPYHDFDALLDCAKNPDLRFVVSNTTEAGIVFDDKSGFDQRPPESFPAKVARLLYERYKAFGSEKGKGFVFLSCELIDNNGEELKRCVEEYIRLWGLEQDFHDWVNRENIFCNTLVDRIVTGYPANEAQELNEANGYEDKLLDTGELFGFWVIEGPQSLAKELPFAEAGLPVIVTDDCSPYKKRKVRILNGVQTTMDTASYLTGQDIARKCMDDEVICSFMRKTVYGEIIPSVDLPKDDMLSFAADVFERLKNPFIDHSLLAISLNTTAKWKARVLPTVKDYLQKSGCQPDCLTFGFAGYIAFYRGDHMSGGGLVGKRGDEEYIIKDDAYVLNFYLAHKDDDLKTLVHAVCSNEQMWGEDLCKLPGFEEKVLGHLQNIEKKGVYESMKDLVADVLDS